MRDLQQWLGRGCPTFWTEIVLSILETPCIQYLNAFGPFMEEKITTAFQNMFHQVKTSQTCTLPILLYIVRSDALPLNALFLSISQEPTIKFWEFHEPVVKVIIKM